MLRDQLGERLIEEAGANFEAPVGEPVLQQAGEARARAAGRELPSRPKIVRDGERGSDRRGRADQEPQAPRGHARRGARQAVDAAGAAKVRARQAGRAAEVGTRRQAGTWRQIRRQAAIALRTFADKPGAEAGRAADKKAGSREQRPIEPPGSARRMSGWRRAHGRIGTGRAAAEKAEVGRASGHVQEGVRETGRRQAGLASRAATGQSGAGDRRPKGRAAAEKMRIVGGEFRGRPLATPRSQSIRPTTDRTREAVFNVLCAPLRATSWTARACSTCSPAPARSGWKRCRAARRTACSSRNRRRAAA